MSYLENVPATYFIHCPWNFNIFQSSRLLCYAVFGLPAAAKCRKILFMYLGDTTIWLMLLGLTLMLVGGLMLWAYGLHGRLRAEDLPTLTGPEAAATRLFHTQLVRWFFWYGIGAIMAGLACIGSTLFIPL